MQHKVFVLSLGGSLIVPGEVDYKFLKNFRAFILQRTKKGDRFIIVTGGGKLARQYNEAIKKVINPGNNELDWIGIHATRLNAHLVQLIFGKFAYKNIIIDPAQKISFKEKVLLAAGSKPGWSTDYVATVLAKTYGCTAVVNLSNIDYVYTNDPRKFKDAQKIERASWKEYRKMFGGTWNPGFSSPFDPVASKFAEQHKQKVYIANGKNLKNLGNILDGKKFIGTVLE